MPVKVFFVDRTTRTFELADSASLTGSVFRITRWNPRRGALDDVEILQAEDVAVAEVSEGGRVTQIISGKQSN